MPSNAYTAALGLVLLVPTRGWFHGTKRLWRFAALHLVLVDPCGAGSTAP